MAIDFQAVAIAMGGTVNPVSMTELVFQPGNRKVLLQELQDMEERAAMQKLMSVALDRTAQVLR